MSSPIKATFIFSLAFSCLVVGCEQPGNVLPPAPDQCRPQGELCSPELDACCDGTFCLGGPYTPEQGRCAPKRADGTFCSFAFECESGLCNSTSRCGPEDCASLGEGCADTTCCAGSFCETNVYLPEAGTCVGLMADGESCNTDQECQSGQCTSGQCGVPACAPLGTECFGLDAPCCEGLVCDIPADAYGPGFCQPRLALGAPCEVHEQCESEICVANRCDDAFPPGEVAFTRVFREVLVPNGCTGSYCHGGGAGGLWMGSIDGAYRALVNAAAAGPGCNAEPRVVPRDLESSVLWMKVAPGLPAPCGSKMPPARGALSAGSLGLLEAWIRAGAPR